MPCEKKRGKKSQGKNNCLNLALGLTAGTRRMEGSQAGVASERPRGWGHPKSLQGLGGTPEPHHPGVLQHWGRILSL